MKETPEYVVHLVHEATSTNLFSFYSLLESNYIVMVQPHPWLVYLCLKSPRGETHASENFLSQRQHVTAYAVPWTHEELWL